ncbi:MAG: dephospho-CoA kinase [Bacteroidales bacterium]
MITAGITGGIGSGKSLVCTILIKLGAAVFLADDESRKLLDTCEPLKEEIKKHFGKDLYSSEGIDKKAFAGIIFSEPEKLKLANSLIHPYVHEAFAIWAQQQASARVVFMEAAILFETGSWKKLDRMVLVYAPEEVRIKRVMERDRVTREGVLERMRYQLPDCEKIKLAHYLINNDGNTPLLPQVLNLWLELQQ